MENTATKESTALAVLEDFPVDKFNLLIPVKTIQEISPLHKVIINQVQIDPDPDRGKDVYKEKNGELALTKKGLAKLMAAANIQIVDSRAVPTQACTRCIELAARTRLAPRCGDCPSRDDVAYQVKIAVPEPSGTWRLVPATKELRMEDEKQKQTAAQFKAFFPYRTEHAETKALNRALREALMVSSTYRPEELQKPFAVALVVPNMADPEIRRAVAARLAQGVDDLYGSSAPAALGPAPTSTGTTPGGSVFDKETGEILGQKPQGPTVIDVDEAPPTLQGDGPTFDLFIDCEGEECGGIVEAFTDKQGRAWIAEELAAWSKEKFGRKLCAKCIQKMATAASQRKGA